MIEWKFEQGKQNSSLQHAPMIRKFFSKVFGRSHAPRSRTTASKKKMVRRIAIEPLESRRLLAVTGTISGYAYLDTQDAGKWSAAETGFAGLTVQLQSVGSQGSLADVSGVGPVQTAANGAYSFPAVPAGTYQIQIEPAPYVMVGQLSPGSEGGTAGSNEIQVAFDGQNATDYNFAILGAKPNYLSLQMFISATDSLATYLPTLDIAPAVAAGGSGSSTNTTTYSTGAAAVYVAPKATIAQTDSPTLASMTVTIQNPVAGEELSVDSTDLGTTLTAAPYANGVLKITGVASVSTYQALLQTLQYTPPCRRPASAIG